MCQDFRLATLCHIPVLGAGKHGILRCNVSMGGSFLMAFGRLIMRCSSCKHYARWDVSAKW